MVISWRKCHQLTSSGRRKTTKREGDTKKEENPYTEENEPLWEK